MTVLLSVILPVWCRPERVRRAILSIASDPQIEVIVVDDGSPDNSAQAARDAMAEADHRGQVIVQENAGPGAARNHGASVATGRYLAFLDSDDIWFPDTTRVLLDFLASLKARGLIFLQHTAFSPDQPTPAASTDRTKLSHYAGFRRAALEAKGIRLGAGSSAILKELFLEHGGFDPSLRASEDTDLFLRLPADCGCDLLRGAALVGIETSGGGQLSTDLDQMRNGLAHLLAQNRAEAYPDPADPDLDRILAQSISYTIRKAFGAGRTALAYTLYLKYLPRLLSARAWHWTIRLPLIPVLSTLRPGRYSLK